MVPSDTGKKHPFVGAVDPLVLFGPMEWVEVFLEGSLSFGLPSTLKNP